PSACSVETPFPRRQCSAPVLNFRRTFALSRPRAVSLSAPAVRSRNLTSTSPGTYRGSEPEPCPGPPDGTAGIVPPRSARRTARIPAVRIDPGRVDIKAPRLVWMLRAAEQAAGTPCPARMSPMLWPKHTLRKFGALVEKRHPGHLM